MSITVPQSRRKSHDAIAFPWDPYEQTTCECGIDRPHYIGELSGVATAQDVIAQAELILSQAVRAEGILRVHFGAASAE